MKTPLTHKTATSELFDLLRQKSELTTIADIKTLSEKGANLSYTPNFAYSPLMYAIELHCNIDIIKYLIEKGGIDWNLNIENEGFISLGDHMRENYCSGYKYYNNIHMCLYNLYNYSTNNWNKKNKQISEEIYRQGYISSPIKVRNKGRKKIYDKKAYELLLQICEALNIKHWMLDKIPLQFPEKMCDVNW